MISPAEIKRLKRAREMAHVSVMDMERSTGVAHQTIYNFEYGKRVTAVTINKLLAGYEDLADILSPDEWIERQVACFLKEHAEEQKTKGGQVIKFIRTNHLCRLCKLMLMRAQDEADMRGVNRWKARGLYNKTGIL